MELTDIMPKEKWVELQNELHERFQLNADVMDKDGKRLAGFSWSNDLCRSLHEDPKGLGAICAPAGTLYVQLVKQGEAFVEECDGGMVRISIPIKVDGELVGAVGGCGLVVGDGEVDEFTIEMMSGLDAEQITHLAKEVKTITEEEVKEIQAFIEQKIADAL